MSSVELFWKTASEVNHDYFSAKRNIEGIAFKPILIQKGTGNSNVAIKYFDLNEKSIVGMFYYRLKQTDFNSKSYCFRF